jgi:hypothetical protein
MTADELLAAIGKMAGMGNLALDGEGVCRLVFDGLTEVDVERSPEGAALHLHSALGAVPPDAGKNFFARLLAGNLYGRQTSGNVLALLPVERTVFLCRTAPLDGVDPEDFAELLAGFVGEARTWAAAIQAGPGATGTPSADGPVDLSNMVRV